MVLFALSCVGLLLFLWLSFGGTMPFNAQGYRFNVAFPNAYDLADQADVRIAGRERRQGRRQAARHLAQRHAGDDPDVEPVRPDPQGRDRDPAREDAARRDLRADQPGIEEQPAAPRRRHAPQQPRDPGGPARPDLQHVRPDDASGVPIVAAGASQGDPGQRPEPELRARQPAARSQSTSPSCCRCSTSSTARSYRWSRTAAPRSTP